MNWSTFVSIRDKTTRRSVLWTLHRSIWLSRHIIQMPSIRWKDRPSRWWFTSTVSDWWTLTFIWFRSPLWLRSWPCSIRLHQMCINWMTVREKLTRDTGLKRMEQAMKWRQKKTLHRKWTSHWQLKASILILCVIRALNRYVRVIGNIKTYQNRRHINATIVRPVDDPMETFFHFNEVMAVTMLINHGPVSHLFTVELDILSPSN